MVDGMNLVLALLPLCSIVHALLPFKSCSRAENQSLTTTVRQFEFKTERMNYRFVKIKRKYMKYSLKAIVIEYAFKINF